LKHFSLLSRRSNASSGFTLIETMVALAIAAAVFAVIAEFAGRTLHNWNRGGSTIAAMEMLTRGLARLNADLSKALPMSPPGTDGSTVYFIGDATHLLFAAATGFGVGDRGLELININVVADRDDFQLVRSRAPVANPPPQFRDPVVLMRGRMAVRFGYRDKDGNTLDSWTKKAELPSAVTVALFGPNGAPIFPAAVVLPVPVNFSVDCFDTSEENQNKPQRCQSTAPAEQPDQPGQQKEQQGQGEK
jgi:prepilin-type N-terminal cleavage/methylation domain-containing protein